VLQEDSALYLNFHLFESCFITFQRIAKKQDDEQQQVLFILLVVLKCIMVNRHSGQDI